MALFLKNGFEATTLDDIAAAADISRRSFFHYFVSKEDVVFAWQEEITAALITAVIERPASESLLTAAENAISAMIGQLPANEVMAVACLKRDNPALQARDQVKYEKLERALAEALGKRAPRKSGTLSPRLVAMIATGVLRVAGEIWIAEGAKEKPEIFAKQTFKAIRTILDDSPPPGDTTKPKAKLKT